MSFNLHVQSVAHLIRATMDNNPENLVRFASYIIWNHASKLVQRINSADLPEQYMELFDAVGNVEDAFTGRKAAETLKSMTLRDKKRVATVMEKWPDLDTEKFGRLRAFLNGKADGTSAELHAFHLFFVNVLKRALSHFKALRKLTFMKTAPEEEKLSSAIEHCLGDLIFLEHFAWRSEFFQMYIETHLRAPFASVQKARRPAKEKIKKADDEEADDEDLFHADTASEHVEVAMEGNLGPEMASQVLAWLRLISATLHYTWVLGSGTQGIRRYAMRNIQFQVVKYPRSSYQLQPWREVIKTLYSDNEKTAGTIIEELEKRYSKGGSHNPKNVANLVSEKKWNFSGRPHCEAMLAVAHFLSQHGKDASTSVSVHVFLQPVLASHVRFQY
jgi:hypothetical protein